MALGSPLPDVSSSSRPFTLTESFTPAEGGLCPPFPPGEPQLVCSSPYMLKAEGFRTVQEAVAVVSAVGSSPHPSVGMGQALH